MAARPNQLQLQLRLQENRLSEQRWLAGVIPDSSPEQGLKSLSHQ